MTSILFLFSTPPHGSINAQEGLDALLMGSAFARCSAVFTGEGVLQLVNGQEPEPLGFRNFSLGFAALRDYGVETVACDAAALRGWGLTQDDLVIPVDVVDPVQVRALMHDHDRILSF